MDVDSIKEQIAKEYNYVQPIIDRIQPDELPFIGFDVKKSARDQLPIYKSLPQILFTVKENDVSIINCQHSFGISSQLPQILFSAGYSKGEKAVLIVQPSDLLTITTSKRVADEVQSQLGQTVGYSIHFNHSYCASTKLKFVSLENFFTELQHNPQLNGYSLIIFDDFQATVNYELALGLINECLQRPKKTEGEHFKFIIIGRNINNSSVKEYLQSGVNGLKTKIAQLVFKDELITKQIKTFYTDAPVASLLETVVNFAYELHLSKPLYENILVFLSSNSDVEKCFSNFNEKIEKAKIANVSVLKIHPGLRIAEQMACFLKPEKNHRTIVFTTNCALKLKFDFEINIVVDSLVTVGKSFNPKLNIDSFQSKFISKSVAESRSSKLTAKNGGECYRLCKEEDFERLDLYDAPDINDANIEQLYLKLKMLKINNIFELNFINFFPRKNLARALESLYNMRIVDSQGQLTQGFGTIVANLQLNHKLSVMLLNSFREDFQCSSEILALVSMISAGRIFKYQKDPGRVIASKKKIGSKEGDMITLVNLFVLYKSKNKFMRTKMCEELCLGQEAMEKATDLNAKLTTYFQALNYEVKSSKDDISNIQRCIFWSLDINAAFANIDQTYTVISTGQIAALQSTSILTTNFPRWIVFYEYNLGSNLDDKIFMTECIEIEENWIAEKKEEVRTLAENNFKARTIKIENQPKKALVSIPFRKELLPKKDPLAPVDNLKKIKTKCLSGADDFDL